MTKFIEPVDYINVFKNKDNKIVTPICTTEDSGQSIVVEFKLRDYGKDSGTFCRFYSWDEKAEHPWFEYEYMDFVKLMEKK